MTASPAANGSGRGGERLSADDWKWVGLLGVALVLAGVTLVSARPS